MVTPRAANCEKFWNIWYLLPCEPKTPSKPSKPESTMVPPAQVEDSPAAYDGVKAVEVENVERVGAPAHGEVGDAHGVHKRVVHVKHAAFYGNSAGNVQVFDARLHPAARYGKQARAQRIGVPRHNGAVCDGRAARRRSCSRQS